MLENDDFVALVGYLFHASSYSSLNHLFAHVTESLLNRGCHFDLVDIALKFLVSCLTDFVVHYQASQVCCDFIESLFLEDGLFGDLVSRAAYA